MRQLVHSLSQRGDLGRVRVDLFGDSDFIGQSDDFIGEDRIRFDQILDLRGKLIDLRVGGSNILREFIDLISMLLKFGVQIVDEGVKT